VATVGALHVAPVKGLRLVGVGAVDVRASGAGGDRAFHVREADGSIASTTRNPRLLQVVPAWDPERAELTLTFPDATRVAGSVERGAAVTTAFWDGRPVTGRIVEGPFGPALSEYAGRPLALVVHDDREWGGDVQPMSLMSSASLGALGAAMGGELDGRRFRMTITVDGTPAWEEHGWVGRAVRVGDAVLRVDSLCERCVVTTRDPESGRTDAPVLKALARLRGKDDVTFGLWCEVVAPGRVRVGDPVAVLPSGR
jgi:uncharacterized protein YcbX